MAERIRLSNQLQVVTKGGGAYKSYAYDGNGNATSDGESKGISYNLLNLPLNIKTGGTTLATYVYDAEGNKLRNTGTDGTWDYINGIVYNNKILFVQTEEGRALPNGNTYLYQYYLKDHLGNTRVTFTKNSSGIATNIQENEYYAFGLAAAVQSTPSPANRYLYNGKELQTDLTNQYDYGARFYDPVIGQFTTVDPFAEIDRRWSPYNYTFGDPIRFTDPDGMWPDGDCCGVVGAFAGGLYNDLKGAVVGTVQAVAHPINTAKGIGHAIVNYKETGAAIKKAAVAGYNKFKEGDAETKAGMLGAAVGEVGQLFGGEAAELGKVGEVGKLAEGAGEVSKVDAAKDVFHVTEDGVALPKGEKYNIPEGHVENPNRKGSYGTMENGKFKEKLRVDPATPTGKKRPEVSHYHLNGGSEHHVPNGKDPGFNGN